MNERNLSNQDLDLLERTRRASSRHLEIPPTPRDTLAVLRQAAETETARNTMPLLASGWFRFAVAALLAVAALSGILVHQTARHEYTPSTTAVSDDFDPGIDLAAWNVEIETLITELDTSLSQLATDQTDSIGWFNTEETSL